MDFFFKIAEYLTDNNTMHNIKYDKKNNFRQLRSRYFEYLLGHSLNHLVNSAQQETNYTDYVLHMSTI